MRERMTRAIALSYGLYLTPALKAALGENATPEKIALLVGGAGVIGIAAKTPARSALGVVGGGLALHQGLKNYLEFDDFLKACAEAKSQADLDLAARQFAKFAARLGVDGLAAFVGGAVAKIAPKALHEADQVMIEATQTIKQRMRETSGWTAEATTAEGIGIARLPVKEDRVIRTQQEMTSVDSGGQASGLRFRIVFQKHVVERDLSVPRKNGIGGAHSLQEFNKCLHEIKVVSRRPHLTVNGVENIKYKIPTLDKTGRPDGGWSARTYEKTVYDSKVISDDRMMAWGRQAYAEAQAAGRFVAPRQWVGTAPNGIAFRGFVDDAGAVVTFFPDM
ncbi:MAG: CdiA family toxin C-terminal domain-containing protein [Pyrinomonadaceae bacterium]